jgi:hypothetical protein
MNSSFIMNKRPVHVGNLEKFSKLYSDVHTLVEEGNDIFQVLTVKEECGHLFGCHQQQEKLAVEDLMTNWSVVCVCSRFECIRIFRVVSC